MKTYTEYLYSFANFSLTLRVIEYLRNNYKSTLDSVAVVNIIDLWLVKVNLKPSISIDSATNLQAFLSEMGVSYQPSVQIVTALARLEDGESPTAIMNQYQLVIVAYGEPEKEEIEVFRQQIISLPQFIPSRLATG